MNKLLAFVLTIMSFNVSAGGYYHIIHQGYDDDTGLFYLPIQNSPNSTGMFSSKSARRVNNILFFDPTTETQSYLFKRSSVWDVKHFTFETNVHKSGEIEFFGSSYQVLNKPKTSNRVLKDLLLIITAEEESELLTMWYATKKGQNLRKVHMFSENDEWHIDLKNAKVRFVTKDKDVSFKSIDW